MEAVVIVVFIMMISLVLIQVGGRYIFNYSISGTEEVALYAQIWMVMIGAGVAMRFGRHVAVDVLVTKLPIPMARVLNILITLGCLWFLYILFVGALPLIEVGFFERSPAMRIPMWTMYQSLTIGAVYFALEVVMWVARRWDDPYGKNETRE
jgi:TRAP-type C4-dicarboxylate transport system permease small subunit